jgi:hypothetical protein
MIPALLAFGVLVYGLFWLRYRLSGGVRLLPDIRPLWLLVLAAVIFAMCRLATE